MKKVDILLSGSLAVKFGRKHERWLDTSTVSEALRALNSTIEGFTEAVVEFEKDGGDFIVFKNRELVTQEQLQLGGATEVRVVPVISGSKKVFGRRFSLKDYLLGGSVVATIKHSWHTTKKLFGKIFPQPKLPSLDSSDDEGNRASYAFGGAVSTTAVGNNVQLLYGERLIGGAYASASIVNYDIRV